MGGAFDEVKVLEKVDTVPQPKTLVHDMHVLSKSIRIYNREKRKR
jgi:hypothetical protein